MIVNPSKTYKCPKCGGDVDEIFSGFEDSVPYYVCYDCRITFEVNEDDWEDIL